MGSSEPQVRCPVPCWFLRRSSEILPAACKVDPRLLPPLSSPLSAHGPSLSSLCPLGIFHSPSLEFGGLQWFLEPSISLRAAFSLGLTHMWSSGRTDMALSSQGLCQHPVEPLGGAGFLGGGLIIRDFPKNWLLGQKFLSQRF